MTQDLDPREFQIPASDGKGHSERVWARISPGCDRQMGIVLGSKFFPYRSKGDIVRHAINRHMAWLEGLAPIPSIAGQVDAINEIMREEEFNREFQDVMNKLNETAGHYLAAGQLGRAKSLVTRVLDKIDKMPESEWKDMYRKYITDRYGALIDDSVPINLLGGVQ